MRGQPLSSPRCKGELHDGTPCPRDVVEGSEWCIFHYPSKAGELVERFNREFVEERRRQEDEHPGFLDFTGFDFPDEVTFENELPMVYFMNATFRKAISISTLDEGSFIFEGYVEFGGATFEGGARFDGATFKGVALFGGATFEGGARFGGATFKGDVEFTELLISAHTSFINTVIERRFRLNILKWGHPPENTSYTLDIKSPVFGEHGKLVITGSLGTTQDFNAGISLLDTEMEKVEFIEDNWPRPYNRKAIIDEVFLTREIEDKIEPPHTLSPERVAQTYRRLRKNYEEARRYPDAGDFLIGEMEVTRKYKQDTDGANVKRSYRDPTWMLHGFYFLLGKYGESISRPLMWVLAIGILVSGFHSFYAYNLQEYSHFGWCFLESLYITFSAMFPITSVMGPFDFFMKLIGSLLLGLIFIALRRRLERR